MNTTVIEIEQLSRSFGDTTAVKELSLQVQRGEVFGFLGHNGAGKTTTIRLLNGILEADSGSARVLGLDPLSDGPALRAQTGVLTESASLDTRLTAWDNLLIYADLFGVPRNECQERVRQLLELFELGEEARHRVATFSTGMRQRLSLARTLLHDPEILFLDEPTSGLDPVASLQTNNLIARLAREKGHTVFMCTHNLIEAQKLCDRVAVMEHGRLVALGTPAELADQYVRRLDVEIETAPEEAGKAVEMLAREGDGLILGEPHRTHSRLTVTASGREAIPGLISLLVGGGVRVYRAAAHEPTLEDVYFALHGEKEIEE